MNKELIAKQIARSMEISSQLQVEIAKLNTQKHSYLWVIVVSALIGALVALCFIVFFVSKL